MTGSPPEEVKVWGLPLRAFHWSLAFCVLAAWLTDDFKTIHEALGYAAIALICLRLVWGVVGPRRERFAHFVAGVRTTLAYALKVLALREPRYLGHNPLGAWMIVALLSLALATSLTGWLFTTNTFWGVKWLEELHEGLANFLIVLVVLHVGGVVFTSYRQGENLVVAMWRGRKPRHTARHPEDAIDG